MTVAAAPELCNFATSSFSSSQGGLHQFFSFRHKLSSRRRQSVASERGFRHLELYRGSIAFSMQAKRSMLSVPQVLSKCRNMPGFNCQSLIPSSFDKPSAQMFAADLMKRGRMLMSLASRMYQSLRNSTIMAGEREVQRVSTMTTAWLPSCNRTRSRFYSGTRNA